ncbi:LysR family transcriptional regulator [Telmatospirillum siberiense]|uniref:LysR family transcriptional regulator n=1 Tax=Telmatospirillum siberiense TaxID=382514 RepID=A0A2N3PTY7_9PROT|nr:LysR family transcriptional regulator [Telmatospirillum siberiense]PKU23875.1 LysR family transcriptional regulator [Telmatospirillum siberiense]
MASLEHYEAFVQTIERGSLTGAAKRLNRSLQSISRALAALEDELGVELVRRTTRRLHPTPAGFMLFEKLRTALKDIENARAEAGRDADRVSGVLRIGASVLFAPNHVVPTATAFLQRFPEVEIELVLNDALADLIEDRLDVAIRIGDLGAASLRSKKIAQLRRVVVAAPSYLTRRGYPKAPSDLSTHLCVVRTFGPEGDIWPLTQGAEIARVPVKGALRCNDAAAANAAVLHGAGIGLAPLWQVRHDIDAGRLELLLPEFEPPPIAVSAVWPASAGAPARTRLFIEMLSHRLAGERI